MDFATYVFDCDGVVLASNAGKSNAFYLAALPYGEDAADRLVELHQTAGSITRRRRWERFFEEILEREPEEGELDRCIDATTTEVRRATAQAQLLPGLVNYLVRLGQEGKKRAVVSGIETGELDEIIREHSLGGYFEHVDGGPRSKLEVLQAMIAGRLLELPAVYFGDTQDDLEAATAAGLAFVFVQADSEWPLEAAQAAIERTPGARMVQDFRRLAQELEGPLPAGENVLVGRDGYATIAGERVYVGATLAGARVNVRPEARE